LSTTVEWSKLAREKSPAEILLAGGDVPDAVWDRLSPQAAATSRRATTEAATATAFRWALTSLRPTRRRILLVRDSRRR